MTTITRESDMVPPVVARLPEGFRWYAEVRGVAGLNRAVDGAADNDETIVAYEFGRKDFKKHVEQVRELCGICDGAYLVWHTELTDEQLDYFAEHTKRAGLIICDGRHYRHVREPLRDPLAQPHILRDALAGWADAEVASGSPTGSANTREAAWLKEFQAAVDEGPLRKANTRRVVGRSPFGGSRATHNAIRSAIDEGRLRVAERNDCWIAMD